MTGRSKNIVQSFKLRQKNRDMKENTDRIKHWMVLFTSWNYQFQFCKKWIWKFIFSFMSAITLLGTPAEIYMNGTQYITLVASYPVVIWSTTKIYLPVFYKLGVSTSYEVKLVKNYFDFRSFYLKRFQLKISQEIWAVKCFWEH